MSISIGAKAIGFFSFIYIAKVLSENDYGSFVYITMVLSLLPLLQLGSMHGTVVLLPKYIANPQKDEKELYTHSNYISHTIQFIATFILFLFDIKLNMMILVVIGANFFFSHYVQNAQMYLNAQHEFQKANIIKGIDQIIKPIAILLLFYQFNNIESIFLGHFLVTLIAFFASVLIVPFHFITIDLKGFRSSLQAIYRLGFFVYLIWAIDILFRTIDKWFISQFYTLQELAEYGFTSSLAMNVWLLAMSFFAPFAQVLYTHVAQGKFTDVKKTVEDTNKKLYILLALISTLAIVFYPFVLKYFVYKYFETEFLFATLVVTSVFLSINNMYIYYMISNNLHFVLLKYQGLILSLNMLLNGVFAYLHLDIVYYSYSTILSLGLYFILVRRYFYIDLEKKLKALK